MVCGPEMESVEGEGEWAYEGCGIAEEVGDGAGDEGGEGGGRGCLID